MCLQHGGGRRVPHAPVAQLDRASDSDSEGHRFDSCRAYHFAANPRRFFYCGAEGKMTCKTPGRPLTGGGNPFREVLEGPQMRNLNRHMGRELRPVLISVDSSGGGHFRWQQPTGLPPLSVPAKVNSYRERLCPLSQTFLTKIWQNDRRKRAFSICKKPCKLYLAGFWW